MDSRTAVVIEGTLNDGTVFVDTTYALVVSAHGCLVAVSRQLELGEEIILRNTATKLHERCRVVYLAKCPDGHTNVGLAFEDESADFWGDVYLPSVEGDCVVQS